MIRNSIEFWFNGHSSKEFGIINCNIDTSGMLEESFLADQELMLEETRHKTYLQDVKHKSKKFDLTFAFTDEVKMDKRHIRNVARWLNTSDYKELWFIEDCERNPQTMERDITKPQRIYFVICEGESKLHHFGLPEGYLTLSFRTNSPYCFSKVKGGDTYVLNADKPDDVLDTDEEGSNSFVFFFNHGDKNILPEISLTNKIENQKIKIIGQPIPENSRKNRLREFDATFTSEDNKIDFSKFPIFEISEGKKAKGNFKLDNTVYDGEKVILNDKTYEFDLGDNLPKNKYETDNILVSFDGGKKAHNTLKFKKGYITDGDTVTIGDLNFEYDFDGIVTPGYVKVDVSEYAGRASGILHLNSNPLPNREMKIGDVNYTYIGTTNEFVIKITDHLMSNGNDVNLNINTNRKTLTQDRWNVDTRKPKNIKNCLVRNITKNPSDLGIRKMKYLDKNFVMVLWNGESDQDFSAEKDISINEKVPIKFNREIDLDSVNNDTVCVKDMEGNKIDITIGIKDDDKTTMIIEPIESYKYNSDYYVYISPSIKDIKGNCLNSSKKVKLHTEEKDNTREKINDEIVLKQYKIFKNEFPKKIKGMRPGDEISLYEKSDLNFCVDENMLIPAKLTGKEKVYVSKTGTFCHGIPDDWTNAKKTLTKYYKKENFVDLSPMTLEQKKQIQFKDGDLVIGGFLAGVLPSDIDVNGEIKTTPPQVDNPKDLRKERVSGIPNILIKPAKRLCGTASEPGRKGTLEAMQNFIDLIDIAQNNMDKLPDGKGLNINLKGITVKYKAPKNATVYGAGTDFYNAIRYLSEFGYKFVNVGTMTPQQKALIPFTKNDIIVGGFNATDTLLEKGKKISVNGIPNINVNNALRLGGKDRFETEILIRNYAESLKVENVSPQDIVKLKIEISNGADTINRKQTAEGDTPALFDPNRKQIDKNIRYEYHRIKSIKQLSRNRLYLEFEENIRTIHYIKSIEVEEIHKKFDDRLAEDFEFTAPYQIRIGYTKDETIINTIKAINDTGIPGIDYSLRTFKHPIVIGQKENDNEILLTAKEVGSQGNIPVNMTDEYDQYNHFLTPTLTGGKDASQSNAIIALAKAIEETNKLPERYNKDRYTCEYDDVSITVTHILKGKKFNNIVCLANVNEKDKTPYFIKEGNENLINLKDYLTYNKSIAKWQNPTLIGGEDAEPYQILLALKKTIEKHQDDEIIVDFNKLEDGTNDKNRLNFEYKIIGEIGNIPYSTTCVNGITYGKKFKGGLDGLKKNEELYFNCERQEIISSLGKDRYKNFNGGWLEVPLVGVKWKILSGDCVVAFRYREKYLI